MPSLKRDFIRAGKQDCGPAEYYGWSWWMLAIGENVALFEGWAQLRRPQRQPFAFAKERRNFAMPPIQRS
jgi:hypothetical protein